MRARDGNIKSEEVFLVKITGVGACPYEDYKGEILNINIDLDEGETLYEGGMVSIEMMDDSFLEREIKIINPKWAGDYGVISKKAKEWERSGKTLKVAKGPGHYEIVVMDVPYHEVKTDQEITERKIREEQKKMVCLSPFLELNLGDESILDYVQEGYVVPDKVIAYLQTTKPYMMCPGIYEHPFIKGKKLLGPYMYTDGHYWWDRDMWKYVVKYHVTLPQEFIDHVMSDKGTEFLKQCEDEGTSWSGVIKDWKSSKQHGLCLLPDDAGDMDIEDF